MTEPNLLLETPDFSLVLGGSVFQLFRRSHLAGDSLELLYRRAVILALVAWLPLVLLATLGSPVGNVSRLSFLHDVEVQVRFLIGLPILVAAYGPLRTRGHLPSGGRHRSSSLAHGLLPRRAHHAHHQGRVLKEPVANLLSDR
jgi:hypothetical protein